MKKRMRIGLLGAGHLGRVHLKCIGLTDCWELSGVYDPDPDAARRATEEFGARIFPDADALIEASDAIDIVTPTIMHYTLAKKAMNAGKHVFIEKPVTHTLAEGEELIEIKNRNQVVAQVGHVERFNPAFQSLKGDILKPLFVEGHRLATFNPRGTDVSVVLDLMIHDIDILLALVKSEIEDVRASGVPVVSDSPDICNARIEFANGCVANLTASRISLKQMRKLRLFQPDAYISLDFLEKEAQVIRLQDAQPDDPEDFLLQTASGKRRISIEQPKIQDGNAIKMELESLYDSILHDRRPEVGLEEAYKALELAYRIIENADERLKKYV